MEFSVPDLTKSLVLSGRQPVHLQIHVGFVAVLLSFDLMRNSFIFVPPEILLLPWLVATFLLLTYLLGQGRFRFDVGVCVALGRGKSTNLIHVELACLRPSPLIHGLESTPPDRLPLFFFLLQSVAYLCFQIAQKVIC